MMRVAIANLRPGDVVQDLVTAGTVADVTKTPTRAVAVRVDYVMGGAFVGPGTFTVTTFREDGDQ